MKLCTIVRIFKNTISRFFSNDPMSYGASIAFYTLISFPAITLLLTMTLGMAYQNEGFHDALLSQLNRFFGSAGANQVDMILENAEDLGQTWWARLIGIGTLVFSATTVFISLQNALNNIWGIKSKPTSSIIKYILNRLTSFAMVISLGFLLLVSLVVDSFIILIEQYVSQLLSGMGFLFVSIANLIITLFLVGLIFTLIFKYLPDALVRWRHARWGGLFTAFLFVFGKFLLGWYLSYTDVGSAYGSAGSLVLFLTWVYYSSIILLFGATFTFELSAFSENKIKPSKHAVFIKEVEVDRLDTSDMGSNEG